MANSDHTINRRSMLAGLGAAATIGAVARASTVHAFANDRSKWDAAMADYASRVDAVRRIGKRVDTAEVEFNRLAPEYASLDLRHFPKPFPAKHEVERTLNLEALWDQWAALEGKAWFAKDADAAKARVRKSIDAVAAYRGQMDRANRLSNYEGLNEQYDAAVEYACEAKEALMAMPAPDTAALSWKLEVGFFEDAIRGERFIPTVRADAQRLLGKPAGVVGF